TFDRRRSGVAGNANVGQHRDFGINSGQLTFAVGKRTRNRAFQGADRASGMQRSTTPYGPYTDASRVHRVTTGIQGFHLDVEGSRRIGVEVTGHVGRESRVHAADDEPVS